MKRYIEKFNFEKEDGTEMLDEADFSSEDWKQMREDEALEFCAEIGTEIYTRTSLFDSIIAGEDTKKRKPIRCWVSDTNGQNSIEYSVEWEEVE